MAKKPTGLVEIAAPEVAGLPLGWARKGDRVQLPVEVAERLVKAKQARYV